jgi:fucokinase
MKTCDYLILTASNEAQADIYRQQIDIRRRLGLLSGIGSVLVVPDIGGKRIGSGGSTLCCLMEILRAELGEAAFGNDVSLWQQALQGKKVLIIHAGGDSKRLPIYSTCGKLFIPVPGQWDSPIPLTLFDLQLPDYLSLFNRDCPSSQFIIASGDVLLRFKTNPLDSPKGTVTGFCCPATSEQASRHGVFCLDSSQAVRVYLQKPSRARQEQYQALNNYQQAMLDIGIMAFDDGVAFELLKIFGFKFDPQGSLLFESPLAEAVVSRGLDFYRELCCTFGSEATRALHRESALGSGSTWSDELLSELFDKTRGFGFGAKVLPTCDFLDFGSVKQILQSGYGLAQDHTPNIKISESVSLNNRLLGQGSIAGSPAWIEGCTIAASLDLKGNNVVTGLDLKEPLSLEAGQCLDIVPGTNDQGQPGWFVRCYKVDDDFKTPENRSPQYCGVSMDEWMQITGAQESDIWSQEDAREPFTARLFPFIEDYEQYRDFLWMLSPSQATAQQIDRWKTAPRFSHKEIHCLTNGQAFLLKRQSNRISGLTARISHLFRPESRFSAMELGYLLRADSGRLEFLRGALSVAYTCSRSDAAGRKDVFISSRILHSLGSAMETLDWPDEEFGRIQSELMQNLDAECLDWLKGLGLLQPGHGSVKDWSAVLKNAAFTLQSGVIIRAGQSRKTTPHSCLRADEIVWARAPARLDIAGGWTDTPPYALEWGGAVLNAAVNLNGQPPIQAYLRVINEPVIKIGSIDLGLQIVIQTYEELANYHDVRSGFSLAKAAFIQEIFSESAAGSNRPPLQKMLETFGGGIELTTVAAIPKGSGLGTSSIMGAVIVAAINCAMGRHLGNKELFNAVLRLEQTLTTGGGWQDQIGGVLEGVKLILTEPGLVANPSMQYLRKDVLEPGLNGGRTLLYYTGITRLAKNILRQVVGKYLDRDHYAMSILKQIRQAALEGAEVMGSKDFAQFGRVLGASWELNKQLDPDSTNKSVEALFERISPLVYGAKLLGAGGGGFVLMACKSDQDARILRRDLTENPCNPNARFFDFNVSSEGLVVTVC